MKYIRESSISIKGMTCNSCVELIESKIGSLGGVKEINVDLTKNKAIIKYDSDKIKLSDIESKIASIGYSTDNFDAKKKKNFISGLAYGLVPHIGCIAFILASIIGSTVAIQFFRPLLMNRYIFYFMILLSFVFATVSSIIYLKKNGFLSFSGIKRKWKYLSVMYGSTVAINLLLFFLIFPLLANFGASTTGYIIATDTGFASMKLQVNIPCPGHAPLISNELKSIEGVKGTEFSFPNNFDVVYDTTETSSDEILSLEVFEEYKAIVLEENVASTDQRYDTSPKITDNCGCGSGSCGGSGSCCGG